MIIPLRSSCLLTHQDDNHRGIFSLSFPLGNEINRFSSLSALSPSKKHRDQLNIIYYSRDFQASSPLETYEWLSLICRCVKEFISDEEIRYLPSLPKPGFRPCNRFNAHNSGGEIYYVNFPLRSEWTNLLNDEKENPLLVLLRFSNRYTHYEEQCEDQQVAHGVSIFDVMHVFSWLVDNGCQLNSQNSLGNTVLHYAIIHNYSAIIRLFLLMRYALHNSIPYVDGFDLWNLPNNEGVTPIMLLEQLGLDLVHDFSDSFMKLYAYQCQWKRNLSMARQRLKSLHSKCKQYSYLRLFFEKQYYLSR